MVGAGPLGAGVAQLCLQSGLEVLLFDDTEGALAEAESRILQGLHRAEQPSVFGLLRKSTRLSRLEECDFAVECAGETPQAKQDMLSRMDARLAPGRGLAVQTEVLPVGMVSRAVENPERVVGMHFFQPVPVAPVVEVIRGAHSTPEVVETALGLVQRFGKAAVLCGDAPGFVVNRLARPYYRAAMRLVEDGKAGPSAVDAALRARGMRNGPFEMLDAVGIDEDLALASLVYELLGRPERLKPASLQEALVARGFCGRRSGGGFYLYGNGRPAGENPAIQDLMAKAGDAGACIADLVIRETLREAQALVSEGIASREDIDKALRLALFWPKGAFE